MTSTNLQVANETGATPVTHNTAQVIAATAVRLGAEHLFELMGGTNMRVIHAFADEGIELHHFRHENGAVGAADGFARATGAVGWSSIIQGPGLTNGLTALRTAVKAKSPQVLVVPDTSAGPARANPFETGIQGLAPDALLAEIGVPVVRVSAATAAQDTVAAHQTALRRLSPVALVVPYGVEAEPSDSDVDVALAGITEPAAPAAPSAAAADAAERALRSAQRIVIIAGRGASDPATARLLERLGELVGAHLSTSVRGVGAFNDSPANLGIFGGFTHPAGVEVIEGADLILSFGAGLNYLTTQRSTFLAGKTVVQVDDDPGALNRYDRADVAVLADASLTARELIARFEASPHASHGVAQAPPPPGFEDVSTPGGLDPRALARRLDALLPAERTVVVDGGHFTIWPMTYMRHEGPDSLLWACDFGAMGCGLGPSIGAAVGRDDRLTVLCIGDCGFYMTMGELEVAVREGLPLLVVCFNDGAAGSEVVLAEIAGLPPDDAIFGTADLAKAASAVGAEAAVIETLDDLEPALSAWTERGPLFLDCRITRSVRSPRYAHYDTKSA
ncbi:thiamine pyrophosphate-binding protein [Microbacterium immunditiarum]|uniref:Thiamine pyrophosphate-dependent acetolactate synthase large subunit-like protein n=1 Tax=Microbacterium immunditiarum TaxID=337480 RepID=A0A7Y9GKP4_9MICO|nr:thiamine pyrophosphate-binding protein [Microbacterium immunditiarum]NYE18287.1 thiamine pyrophosphate-dependent acetolactate synthase large subunit-like protein [Microbacterium immunditiarum]